MLYEGTFNEDACARSSDPLPSEQAGEEKVTEKTKETEEETENEKGKVKGKQQSSPPGPRLPRLQSPTVVVPAVAASSKPHSPPPAQQVRDEIVIPADAAVDRYCERTHRRANGKSSAQRRVPKLSEQVADIRVVTDTMGGAQTLSWSRNKYAQSWVIVATDSEGKPCIGDIYVTFSEHNDAQLPRVPRTRSR